MMQRGQRLKLIFTEDREPNNNPISWINYVNLFPNTGSWEHFGKLKFQGCVKIGKEEPWRTNHCCDHFLKGKAPLEPWTMLLQHLWIKKGRTQHGLGELCQELVCSRQTKANCVYYRIIDNCSFSKGQSKDWVKEKWDTNAEIRQIMRLWNVVWDPLLGQRSVYHSHILTDTNLLTCQKIKTPAQLAPSAESNLPSEDSSSVNMKEIAHFKILNKTLKIVQCTSTQTIELPALAWSPLTNSIQRAQFSPHHNLLSAHPHLLLLFSTILTGEPVKILCFPFSCAFSPAAAEGWARVLFMSHEWCFGKGDTLTV